MGTHIARRNTHAPRRWRVLGQSDWQALGKPFSLGAGFVQTVAISRAQTRCDEPGCGQLLLPGDVYVAYWRVHGVRRQEVYCVAHAPVTVELR